MLAPPHYVGQVPFFAPGRQVMQTKTCRLCARELPLSQFRRCGGEKRRGTCQGCLAGADKAYHAAHRSEAAAYQRKYRADHPEYPTEWNEQNRERRRNLFRRYRARTAQVAAELTGEQWEAIVLAFCGTCAYCGSLDGTTMDHVIPISKGGAHVADNVVPACLACNSAKGNRVA